MKITLPNRTVIELDDTPSDVVEKNASSGDPVATEKRAGAVEPSPAAEEATPEQVAELKAHPEESWVQSPRPKPEPEPEKPRSAGAFTPRNGAAVIGGINDIFDPGKGKSGFQYQYKEEKR
jgi:hypothetical protein